MSLLNSGQSSQVCPRCKIILPINQIACYNCGFLFAAVQSGNPSRDIHVPPSPARRPPSSPGIAQFKGGPPSSPGISQSPVARGETPALVVPQTRGMPPLLPEISQVARGETPALGVPQTRAGQVLSPEKAQVPASSRVNLARKGRIEKDQSPLRKHATLVYLITVMFVIVVIVLAGLNAAGISLSTFTPHVATPPGVTYPLPKVVPIFADSFLNDASGWNLQSSPGNYAVNVGNGALTMEVDKNKLLWEPLPGLISYADFILTVNAVLTKGDQNNGYGLYIRGATGQSSELDTYYRFELYGDGSYAIFKGTVDQRGKSMATKVVPYTLSAAIQKQGKPNQIMLLARGASISFVVNGQLLKTLTDTSYATGSIALFASHLSETKPGMQVQFSQFALYPSHVSRPS